MRALAISQRGWWSTTCSLANCSLLSSSWATGARSFRFGWSTSPVNGTHPKARVEGRSTPSLCAAASAPVRHPHFVVVLIVTPLTLLIGKAKAVIDASRTATHVYKPKDEQ